jgi:hypothetical protein
MHQNRKGGDPGELLPPFDAIDDPYRIGDRRMRILKRSSNSSVIRNIPPGRFLEVPYDPSRRRCFLGTAQPHSPIMSRPLQPSGLGFVRFHLGAHGRLQVGILRRARVKPPKAIQVILLIPGRYAPGPFVEVKPQVDNLIRLRHVWLRGPSC